MSLPHFFARQHGARVLVSALAGALIVGACSSSSFEGTRVDLRYTQSGRLPTLSAGDDPVSIDRLAFTVGTTELIACPQTARLRLPSLVPTAHAHSTSTPTLSGVPVAFDGLGSSSAELVRGLNPPPDETYCEVKLTILGADNDGLDAGVDPAELVNRALEATLRIGDNELSVSTSHKADRTIAFDEAWTPVPGETLVITFDQGAFGDELATQLHDGIDLPALDNALLRSVVAGFELHIEAAPDAL